MLIDAEDDDAWETFVCSSCGYQVTRLKCTFDFPVCGTCRMWDAIDPSGKLRRERNKRLNVNDDADR